MEDYIWSTPHAHPNNEFTMKVYLNEHLPDNFDLVMLDGTYAQILDKDTGEFWAIHSGGDGDFTHHRIRFEHIYTFNRISEPVYLGLNELAESIYQDNKKKGFWDKERNVGEMLMLITSELGEAMEAHRKGRFADWDLFHRECENSSWEDSFKTHIKDTVEDEIADAIIRLLDMSAGLGIDIERHIQAKLKYNRSREKLHGKKY